MLWFLDKCRLSLSVVNPSTMIESVIQKERRYMRSLGRSARKSVWYSWHQAMTYYVFGFRSRQVSCVDINEKTPTMLSFDDVVLRYSLPAKQVKEYARKFDKVSHQEAMNSQLILYICLCKLYIRYKANYNTRKYDGKCILLLQGSKSYYDIFEMLKLNFGVLSQLCHVSIFWRRNNEKMKKTRRQNARWRQSFPFRQKSRLKLLK